MTNAEKLTTLKTLLEDGGALPSDTKLNTYIQLAESEILQWRYHLIGGVPSGESMQEQYDVTQIYAVVAGFTQAGAEGQKTHNENGTQQAFVYADMVDYIHQNVTALARVGAIE